MKKLFVIAVLAIFTNAAFAATSIHAEVKGMVCAFCAKGINKKLRELDSTQDVWVDLKSRIVVVQLKDQKTMSLEAFTKLIKDAGYDVANVEYINKTLLEIKADHTHISNEVKK
jgi:mercuric ion binding protein